MSCYTNLIFLFFFTGSSPRNHHLIVVERFVCPNEPVSCAVWCLLLVGSPKAICSLARGQTKNGSRRPMEDDEEKERYLVDSRFTSRYKIDYYAFDVLPCVVLVLVSRSGLRASVKCLNCKLLPEDSRFASRLHICQQTSYFAEDFGLASMSPDLTAESRLTIYNHLING